MNSFVEISLVSIDHGADRVGNIYSTVYTVVSRNIAVNSIVSFNLNSRTSPVLVDPDLTGIADYRSHWESSPRAATIAARASTTSATMPVEPPTPPSPPPAPPAAATSEPQSTESISDSSSVETRT